MRNYYLDGMMGLIVGDAVGVPYEFSSRGKLAAYPASDMIGYGTYNVPQVPGQMTAVWRSQHLTV